MSEYLAMLIGTIILVVYGYLVGKIIELMENEDD